MHRGVRGMAPPGDPLPERRGRRHGKARPDVMSGRAFGASSGLVRTVHWQVEKIRPARVAVAYDAVEAPATPYTAATPPVSR